MKRTGIIIFAGALLFTACQKQQLSNPLVDTTKKSDQFSNARKAGNSLVDQVKVSSYGFLILADSNAYADYLNFLDSNTAEDIRAFHSSIGFTSQATLADQAGNYFNPSVHNAEYIFSQTAMIQIGSVIYRGVNSEGYYLAMPISRLSETTYNALASKTFDREGMCRLKVGGDYGDNLEAFVNTHVGYDDPSQPPTPIDVCGRKITHTYSGGGVTIVDESWYFLGFRYRHVVTIYDGRP